MQVRHVPLNPQVFRRRHNYYLAAGTELLAPLLRVGARSVAGVPTPPGQWRRGLILSHSHLGDILYRTCSLNALSERLPECRWSYLVTPQGGEVLQGNSAVHEILPLLSERSGKLPHQATGELRDRYDVVLCTNTFRIGADLSLALRLRAPNRVAFDFKGLTGLITHPVPPTFPRPYAEYFRQMVAAITVRAISGELRPRVYPSDSDNTAAMAALQKLELLGDSFLVCAPGARQPTGAAPPSYVAAVLREIARGFAGPIVLIGSAAEADLLREIARRAAIPPRILAGDLGIRAIVPFIARAEGALTQDSGPRHLANAAGARVFFFRNLVVPRIETGAYCPGETDLSPDRELLTAARVSELYAVADPVRDAAAVLAGLSASESRRRHTAHD